MSGIDLHRGFDLTSTFVPMGDQPRAIAELTEGMARGERYQTLLGATGTGKSVGYDDPVFVAERTPQGLVPRLLPIGQLIDEAMEAHPPAKGADGTEVLDLPGDRYFTQAYDPETGEVGLFPVSAFTRHTTPDTMYDLETSCGRSITLTGDHNLWVLRDGALRLIETADARPTDYVPLPERVPELSTRTSLNTLQVLRGERLFVDARTALLEYIEAEGVGALASSMKTAGLSHPYTKIKALRDQAKGRGRLTMDAMQQVLAETDDLGGHWRADEARIGGQAPYNDVPASLTMTPSFMRLVGYYVAEGCQARGYFVMANRDPGVRQDIEDALTDLGLPFSVRPSSDYQISSTALTRMLHHLCGDDARGKRLPDFWPTLPQHLLAVLLRAYFDGDGTVGHASDVTATTASADLASDLAYALFRFGIWARISRRHKRATNSEHAGDWYYQVTVSGQANLHRYAEAIGFSIPRKQEALARQMDRTSNSNVDVVPIDGSQLRWLRQHVQLSANVLGERSGLSRSGVQLVETNQRRPGRSALVRLLDTLREEAVARNMTTRWWEAWRALRRLTEVRWTPIASVTPSSYNQAHVYDFTVPGPETFLAGRGGLFVHNTFSASHVIQNAGMPTLVMSHNKTLAAQLYAEFKSFFPENAVEFFISYYDYYQPEAYIVSSDTYIEKDMAINDQIDRLRLRATSALVSGRKDVIVVASVSCIYGLGSPEEYKAKIVQVGPGTEIERNELLRQFIGIFYARNDVDFTPGVFRVRGDIVDIFPAYLEDIAYRISFWGDEIETIQEIDPLTGETRGDPLELLTIYPAKIFVTPEDQMERAIASIQDELRWRLAVLRDDGRMLEAQRLEQRTLFDIEMMKEVGYCSGIENYSRHLTGRAPGERPYCLFDYFPDDYLLVIDESHVTLPQVRAMYNGDRARKLNLVEHGFRLPSALDNRPMTFEEFEHQQHQVIFVSATPADYELEQTGGVFVEQVIRPTGIPDPEVFVRPTEGQIDDLLEEVQQVIARQERVLVTTLTKRMAEDLADYLGGFGIQVRYLHSDIDALERVEILRDLRLGTFDVLIGVNLLREGLDLPEVSLVAILDADKEGFLRSDRSLIQTAGRAARNVNSKILMYANRITGSMQRMMDETERRRTIQLAYNEEHGIIPQTVRKSHDDILRGTAVADEKGEAQGPSSTYYSGPDQAIPMVADPVMKYLTPDQKRDLVQQMQREMTEAVEKLEFERAAELRDQILQLEEELRNAP